jgi:cysteine synthase A
MRVNNILETIGNTPHVRLNRLYANVPGAEVWLKLERANPGASIKDRIGIAMIEDAERRGILKKGGVIAVYLIAQSSGEPPWPRRARSSR